MEDVVETLLGLEIVDEDDKNEDMQVLARRLWERRARAMGLQLDDKEDQPSRQEPQGAS
jgi:CBS domain containing-hemolysin-like protein